MTGIALLLWWMRTASINLRWLLAVFGLVVPLAAMTLAPPIVDYILDGVFFGTVIGITLWLIRTATHLCCNYCCRLWHLPGKWKSGTTATVLLIGTFALQGMAPTTASAQPQQRRSATKKKPGAEPTVVIPYGPDESAPVSYTHLTLPTICSV